MAIHVALNHRTSYRYDRLVTLSPHVIRLRPAPHSRTPILSYSMKVLPEDHFVNWQQDPYSNYNARLVFNEPAHQLQIEVDLVAELKVINPFDFFLEEYAEHYPFAYPDTLKHELQPYLAVLPEMQATCDLVGEIRKKYMPKKRRTIDVLVDVNRHIQELLRYDLRMEAGVQTPDQTLTKRNGSCRDFSWLLVQTLRRLGVAARFVSGYSIQLKADQKALDGPSGVEEDVTDLHAWTEVFLPGAGWVGIDSTSGLFCGEGHIPLACTADPGAASPITGSYTWNKKRDDDTLNEDFTFHMSVTRIHEDPRVTKPYTDAEWMKIDALGKKIDADMEDGDVRLTMGGEPTFVSIDDMDGEEWNTEALGERKRRLGEQLVRRLKTRFAPGALLHTGQGKWYPGESLPRWALSLYWRKDGVPVWLTDDLLADWEVTHGHTDKHADAFIRQLADRLKVNPDHAQPGYEDAWYYMWKERRLPVNVDPIDNKLELEWERERLARIYEQGLNKLVGYALPLRRTLDSARWESGAWFFRPERMYLIPGDSPMGYRLPLDSIPWVREEEYPHVYEHDTSAPRSPLPGRGEWGVWSPGEAGRPQSRVSGGPAPTTSGPGIREQRLDPVGDNWVEGELPEWWQDRPPVRPERGKSAPWIVRTAMCVEARDGVLHVFMPPLRHVEEYLQLVEEIEKTANDMGTPIRIEGYHPPSDHRIENIKVTPDPGVLEVNIHPSSSWDELVHNTTTIYEEARQTRLGTEKFMLDGRHSGTGGGNHIIVGAGTPQDSPLLRRPDLLKSLIAYWLNHPSLSYLFSGMFVGPTSQAPRVDEARHDQVHELEVAFNQIKSGEPVPPWTVDRVFRNLLVDATGNTHRAEFCIDKLFPPEGRRHGLLELRSFEMPPHPRMSLVQHLLLRGLIGWMWQQPYERRIVKWGAELHDRFMLPHFVREDFGDVLDDLTAAGYRFDHSWFNSHFEFRFPQLGKVAQRDIELELRTAIEPWHVLGEEPGAGGTVRFVDSSLERLQVMVDGMVDERHIVCCNGVPLPLHPTGVNGQFVCGVRYRAWQPPECLHPTIGVHTPLVFDVVDSWTGRSIGGCTYHVSHPGGLSYDRFPVNAYEAESRRTNRFIPFGHTPGPMEVGEPKIHRQFPFTLDLRRS